ncbi:ParB N-terminal domain-containing protein [Candidatus Bathyarchaeota archaeon]|nr:ParB N-terminal domain-containing protein [Candidatus Bathyarchaeota archaeon]
MKVGDRELKLVPASKIHFSGLLPTRDSYDDKILESMKKDGIQQPLIVRPHPRSKGEYEMIDGHMRYVTAEPDDLLFVDIRTDIKDSEVFRISDATFKREPLSTYRRAEFIFRWVETVKKERGKRGAQALVAKEARLTEGEISQYLSIRRMFIDLEGRFGSAALNFDALKNQSINKLYELSKLTRTPSLLKIAEELAEKPTMPVRELRRIVQEETNNRDLTLENMKKMMFEDSNGEASEAENLRKQDLTKTVSLVKEIIGMAEDARQTLGIFRMVIKQSPERYLNPEIFRELRNLHRRHKRLCRDIGRLRKRAYTKA